MKGLVTETLVSIILAILAGTCGPGCAAEDFVSPESAKVFAQEMVSALNEGGFMGDMSSAAKAIVQMVVETGTIDEWLTNMSGEYINPSLIVERYERSGLKIGLEGGSGQIDLRTGGKGSALTIAQQATLNQLVQDLIATGDSAKMDLAREILDVMRRAQGVPQVPVANDGE